MKSEIKLLEELFIQAKELPVRDEDKLYALITRADMLIRRILGESSHYLTSLGRIQFIPNVWPSSNEVSNQVWSEGHSQIISLVNTMIEERQTFDSVPTPVLTVQDDELSRRTSDLLSAPDKYDRVVREATTILEDRIRDKVPFADLAKIMPNAADQMGENLVNKLFSPKDPIIVSGDKAEQVRLFKMLIGVVAYLRNPSHHSVDDNVQWSWAWSVVGLIDQLLEDLASATYKRPANL